VVSERLRVGGRARVVSERVNNRVCVRVDVQAYESLVECTGSIVRARVATRGE